MSHFAAAVEALLEESETSDVALSEAVNGVVAAARGVNNRIDSAVLHACIKRLRSARLFTAIQELAEGLEEIGVQDALLRLYHAQALIESQKYHAALGLLTQTRELALSSGQMHIEADSWGLEGRVYKDLFIRGCSSATKRLSSETLEDFAHRSITAYHKVWLRGGNPPSRYHGVNAMAVALKASRVGLHIPRAVVPTQIAKTILDLVNEIFEAHKDNPSEHFDLSEGWAYADAAEASAALGQWNDAIVWINRYLSVAKHDAFKLTGTLRQFVEVWDVNAQDPTKGPVVAALQMSLVMADKGGMTLSQQQIRSMHSDADRVEAAFASARGDEKFALADSDAADTADTNERVHGSERPVTMTRLKQIMDKARYVGRIKYATRSGVQTVGTGFLMHGSWIDKATLADKTFLFTNAHVISDNPTRDQTPIGPGDAVATFDLEPDLGELDLDKLVWCSGQHDHDISVFEVDVTIPGLRDSMKIAKGLPHLKRKISGMKGEDGAPVKVPGTVYVIGHPEGGEMSYSLYDNELIDHENYYGPGHPGPAPRRIHYRAPTQKGNSGSPVFNSVSLEVIGVHHRGGRLRKLNGNPGHHSANEGLWIRPAINELRMALGLTGDMFEQEG
nr:serine protease [Hyphomonas sp. Mor2]